MFSASFSIRIISGRFLYTKLVQNWMCSLQKISQLILLNPFSKIHMKGICLFVCLFLNFTSFAQNSFKALIKDSLSGQPITGAVVREKQGNGSISDADGYVSLKDLPAGKHIIIISDLGYHDDSLIIVLPDTSLHEILLRSNGRDLEEVTVLASTRTNERIENAPIKVEVLGKEEMEEENTIKPASIIGIIGDVSGIQIQQTSAVSGDANVRVQGLGGQYTQLLRDGMPLFDGFSGGFSIMQIPPLDLKQIELIKGSASTLYGGGAIGGLINLISKRPGENQEAVFTLNQTSLKETDMNVYLSKRYNKFGYTFFSGLAHQEAADVNNDGFSDVPKLNTFIVHPRLFFYPDTKTTIIAGYTGTFETRTGGDMQFMNGNGDSVHQFYEKNNSVRNTGEVLLERTLPGLVKLTIKGSFSSFTRDIESPDIEFKARQLNYYSEASLFIPKGENTWVTGINLTGLNFTKLPSDSISLNDFSNSTIGAFAQYTAHLPYKVTAEVGLRADHDSKYGDFILPRLALFHRFNELWATRMGLGLGYKLPNPLVQQTIDYPIDSIQPLPANIKAEKSVGYNVEFNFKKEIGNDATVFINQAFYLTRIDQAVIATQIADGSVFFNNAGNPVITKGFDTYMRFKIKTLELYAGYTYTDAERTYLVQNQFMPLTPRNRCAFTVLKEIEGKWRFGIEGSYFGPQYRDGDTQTPAYFTMATMIERKFGKKICLVLNGENLFDYRQSRYESLYTGNISAPYFKPLWAPIDGRVINLSFRFTPFNK